MYRQRNEVRGGGANYSTELAGRDRFIFFRRPVEPSGGELHAGGGVGIDDGAAAAAAGTAGAGGNGAKQGGGHASTWNSAQVRYAASTPAAASLPLSGGRAGGVSGRRPGYRGQQQQGRPSSVEPLERQRQSRRRLDGGNSRGRAHHLPTLGNQFASTMPSGTGRRQRGGRYDGDEDDEAYARAASSARDAGVQTVYRENEAQTDPYTPDYYLPDGAPEPEVLKLAGLTYQNGGLPAGKEEVELIQRLRRRRELEAALPTGNDDASIEARFQQLHALEEEEWRDREAHVEQLQARRLERIKTSLFEREAAHESANQQRLERIKQQYLSSLSGKLTTMHSKAMGDKRRAMDRKIARNKAGGIDDKGGRGAGGGGGASARQADIGGDSSGNGRSGARGGRPDLIESYVNYGARAAPPAMSTEPVVAGTTGAPQGGKSMVYDVRPALLTVADGVEEVDATRGTRIEHVPARTFVVPENEAIARLPTLYQRHEAQKVVQSLEYAHQQIQRGKLRDAADGDGEEQQLLLQELAATAGLAPTTAESKVNKARSVLELYKAPPKVQRPSTPELELDGDAEEEVEEACILLQRLLRGRAVQNDFFEGKERCRGLIQELQAASDAKEAEQAVADLKELEALAAQQSAMVDDVLSVAMGDVISDTLGYLYQELDRQRDARSLEALRAEAEAIRRTREATELARREAERHQRDHAEAQYAALVRATGGNVDEFLSYLRASVVRDTALAVAVEAEQTRQGALPAPRDPAQDERQDKEDLVCDMLDGFVIPAVVDSIQLQARYTEKRAPASAAKDIAHGVVRGELSKEKEEKEEEEEKEEKEE